MVICIEMSERTKQELDHLVEIGKYGDYASAVSMAISNQLVLHKQISKSKAVVVLGNGETPSDVASSYPTPPLVRSADSTPLLKVPSIFSALPQDNFQTSDAARLPDDVFVPGQAVPVDRWIFGQHNKLLPAKASCRALANMLRNAGNGERGVLLEKAAAEIAEQAVMLGDYLHFIDEKFEVSRDDAYSTAFPFSKEESEDKARLRYANQFVASMSKQGRLTGLLVDLKLINNAKSKAPKVLLTDAGWNFAKLANPLLDSTATEGLPGKFSAYEKSFFVRHIREHVPAEDFAYRTILNALSKGEDTPGKLDAILKLHLSIHKPFTDAFITTQRSGVISRMADLGLVDRVRDGIRVTYVATLQGNEFIQKPLARVSHE